MLSFIFFAILIVALIGVFRPYRAQKLQGVRRWQYGLVAFAAFILIGITAPNDGTAKSPATLAANVGGAKPAIVGADQAQVAPAASAVVEPTASLTGPQQHAARSATAYLEMTGFSRKGLIEQLSSSAGDGYDVADATAAVDSLTVDWNEQAAHSAKRYLEMTGFSCKGLIEQLSSNAGDKYTREQASYGANAAGAC